jgi:Rrf2 family iron-sulfur cluster assembly transcriptional regulator
MTGILPSALCALPLVGSGVRITTWAEYGLICTLHLARRAEQGPITGRDIASKERLPADYVEQILLRLRRAGIIRSTRGARGGYVLERPAAQITVRDVIQASELATFELHCVTHPVGEDRCADSQGCSIRPVWQMLQRRIDDVLESVCVADLLEEESVVRERVGLPRRPIVEAGTEPVAAPLADVGGRRGLPVLQS